MAEFLRLSLPGEALSGLFAHLAPPSIQSEQVDTAGGLGRVTASAIFADEDLPAFPRSTVDGFAVRAADTHGASEGLPCYLTVTGQVTMGKMPGFQLKAGQAGLIHTGGMLPDGADAVVMVENTQSTRPEEIEIYRPAATGENVIRIGEDVKKGDLILDQGVLIRPAEIGGLMALGICDFSAVVRPKVGIISSGDEVIDPHLKPSTGQVRDVNSFTLGAFVGQCGGIPLYFGIARDDAQELKSKVTEALADCDLVVITAGSSASVRDLTADVLNSLGEPGVLVHGVNVKPGKPTILAVCSGKAVIGLPGNPVSALVIARIFVRPVIFSLLGIKRKTAQHKIQARLATNLASQAGREDWIPVRLNETVSGLDAEPIFYKSNLIFSLIKADGLLNIEADQTGLSAGEMVEIEILN